MVVADNIVKGVTALGIHITLGSALHYLVSGNVVLASGGDYGITLATPGGVASGNLVRGFGQGIRVEATADKVLISGNAIDASAQQCVYVNGADDVSVRDNEFTCANGVAGVLSTGARTVVAGNRIANGDPVVEFSGANGVIAGNALYGTRTGINLAAATG